MPDLVVAAGIRPNVQLARDAGLQVRRGIVVGDDLSCPGTDGVYAIGECAEHRGELYGLVAPLWEQAHILADRLTRRRPDSVYQGSQLTTKLKVAGLDVAVMGARDPSGDDDEVITEVRAFDYDEVLSMIAANDVVDAKTIAGIVHARRFLR